MPEPTPFTFQPDPDEPERRFIYRVEGGACDLCKSYEGRIFKESDILFEFPYAMFLFENIIEPRVHPNCLKPGTLIHTRAGLKPIEEIKIGDMVLTHQHRYRPVIELHRNPFEGMLYSFNGSESWMTGNHPVLTSRGWVDAEAINKGENIIQLKPMPIEAMNNPSLIGQRLLFSSVSGDLPWGGVPVSPVNLNSHFKFRNGKVDVKDTEGILWDNFNFSFFEGGQEQCFKTTEPVFPLDPLSPSYKHILSFGATSDLIMKCFNLVRSFLRRHLFPSKIIRRTSISNVNGVLNEPFLNGVSSAPVFGGECFHGRSPFIEPYQFINGKFNPIHITSTITDIDRMLYKGDVFNISVAEDETYLIGDSGIIVHNCRCQLRLVEESLMSKQESMHRDFIRIQNEFTNYYCKSADACEQGTFEFNAWVQDLGINTSKPYGQCLEAFQWAKHMISKYKEDAKHTYYKVLFAFPIESMNGNVYTEEEIMNSVKSVIGQSPSINHWEDTRKDFEAGGVVYVGAAYEDGACEAILKVPNGFICPLCDKGKPLTEWIDEKKIVNVSLEATCKDTGEGNICLGLEFKAPTLLTSDTLPGIPLARISPMEKFIPAILAREGATKVPRKKKIEVKLFDEELPDEAGQCPPGMKVNAETGICEKDTDCPDGQHWNDAEGKCVPDITPDPEKVAAPIGVSPTPAEKKALMEAMTEDEIKTKIADLSSQLDALYGSEPEPVSSTDYSKIDVLQAELDGYKAALTTLIRANAVAPPVGEQQDCDDGMVWDAEAGQCVPDTGEAATPSAEKAGLELKISELELANLQKEQQFKSTEEQVLFLQTKVKQAIIDSMTLTAELKASENMVSKLETSVTKRDKTILDKERTISEKNTAIQRMADDHKEVLDKATERAEVTNESREQYKTQLEELRDHMEKLDTKYNAQLDINLAQTLKLTETNEKMADLVAEQGELKAQVKKAKRLSKVIISME